MSMAGTGDAGVVGGTAGLSRTSLALVSVLCWLAVLMSALATRLASSAARTAGYAEPVTSMTGASGELDARTPRRRSWAENRPLLSWTAATSTCPWPAMRAYACA
jgi:hypothetical protein